MFFACFLCAACLAFAATLGSVRVLRAARRRGWGPSFALAYFAAGTSALIGWFFFLRS